MRNLKNKIISLILTTTLLLGAISFSFADSATVVTLGSSLNKEQRVKMLKYFGVDDNYPNVIYVTNQDIRKHLEGIATETQLGTEAYSCAYIEPTSKGDGLNVKTANLTWVTSSMISSTLITTGISDANVVVASLFPVTGSSGLTGILMAYEEATGITLDEEKKEIASEELILTGDLGEDIGQDKAAGIVNDIKTEIIKNNTSDTVQIAETIINITNNYNVTLAPAQEKELEGLMTKISKQDYDYNEIKDTLNSIKDTVSEKLDELGESVNKDFFESVKIWFTGIGNWFTNLFSGNEEKDLGILESTNDSMLGEDSIIDATDKDALELPLTEEAEGFFTKILNWITGLFDNSSNTGDNINTPSPEESNTNLNTKN